MAVGRSIMAIVNGLVISGLVIAVTESVGHVHLRGEAIFGTAVIGYKLGSTIGTTAATIIADRWTAATVPVLLAALATFNLLSFAHPLWFTPATATVLIAGWWIGSIIARRWKNARIGTAHP